MLDWLPVVCRQEYLTVVLAVALLLLLAEHRRTRAEVRELRADLDRHERDGGHWRPEAPTVELPVWTGNSACRPVVSIPGAVGPVPPGGWVNDHSGPLPGNEEG